MFGLIFIMILPGYVWTFPILFVLLAACSSAEKSDAQPEQVEDWQMKAQTMVRTQIERRGVRDSAVLMTELLQLDGDESVLEIGTGSGYQAAVLSPLCKQVFSIEIVPELAESAEQRLEELSYKNIQILCGDGYAGWPEHAPFDGIIVTAAPPEVPLVLIEQLKPGGRLVLPVGGFVQDLIVITRQQDGTLDRKTIIPVRFVPMVKSPDPTE